MTEDRPLVIDWDVLKRGIDHVSAAHNHAALFGALAEIFTQVPGMLNCIAVYGEVFTLPRVRAVIEEECARLGSAESRTWQATIHEAVDGIARTKWEQK